MKGMSCKHQWCLNLFPGTYASSVASLRNQRRAGTGCLLSILSSVLPTLIFLKAIHCRYEELTLALH